MGLCALAACLMAPEAPSRAVLLLGVAGVVAYAGTRLFAVRLAVAGLVLPAACWVTLSGPLAWTQAADAGERWMTGLAWWLFGLLALGAGAWMAAGRPGRRTCWQPLAWAALMTAAGLAVVLSLWAQVDAGAWTTHPGRIALWLCAWLPGVLLGGWMAGHRPALPPGLRWGAPVACCLAGLGWVAAPLCSVGLTVLVLACRAGHRPAQGLAVLLGLAGLVLYYFDVAAGTLLGKALGLGLTAVWLAVLSAGLWACRRRGVSAARPVPRPHPGVPWALLAGGVLVLCVVQFQVHRYETILAQGRPVVLALAPVDPRSLMQGDYMDLDYAVRRQAEHGLDPTMTAALAASGRGWLRLRPDAQGIWQLQAVTDEAPGAPGADTVALAFHWRDGRIDWGARHWFFAEGQGDHYAQARYGVLRVAADGTALLAGLLDQDQAPL